MLTGLTIKDVVLIEALDLEIGPGLTALTGETGAGKSIVLDALGLATGQRADAGLVRRGAAQATAGASFVLPPDHPAWRFLAARGLDADPAEPLILRRQLTADGRSRAFIADQPAGVAVLRELGALLIEVHGQHETVGLLDPRTHRPLLDAFGALGPAVEATGSAWRRYAEARASLDTLSARTAAAQEEAETLSAHLADLDRRRSVRSWALLRRLWRTSRRRVRRSAASSSPPAWPKPFAPWIAPASERSRPGRGRTMQ
jgi:DNA repair protein RecN (Recombination protein N)